MDEQEIQATKTRLGDAARRYRRHAAGLDEAGKAAMVEALALLRAGVAPSEVERLSPFTDSYIRKAAREAGIPPARPARGITKPAG